MIVKDGAKVFIKNNQLGKYLFFLRDDKPTIPNPNMYGLLGGGIEAGETPLEALEREIKEESNIEVYNIEELGEKIFNHIVIKEDGSQEPAPAKVFHFLAQTDATLDGAELFEGQRLEYFTIEEALQKDLAPAVRVAIKEYR